MKDRIATMGSDSARDLARSRLVDYLRALRLTNEEQLEWIISRVLERAAGKQAEHPGRCLAALAIQELRVDLERWFTLNLPVSERAAVTGLLAWFALDASEQWAAAFLAEDPPKDFQRMLQACQILVAPPLRVSSMVPRAFANPLGDAVNLPAPWGKLARGLVPMVTRAATAALSALSLLSGVRLW